MSDLVYLSGAPGAGKSTLMAALTEGLDRVAVKDPVPHDIIGTTGAVAELGKRRNNFPGTDTLAMNIQPKAVAWIGTLPYRVMLGEGDRLGNSGFLTAAVTAGYRVWLFHLGASGELLDQRCALRGSKQNLAWRAGRATKADNLAKWARTQPGIVVTDLDARTDPATNVLAIRQLVPALKKALQ